MRVTFTDHIKTLSGKCHCTKDIFSSWHNDKICFLRRFTRPYITENNRLVGLKLAKAAELYHTISMGFKQDLERYADAYNKQLLSEKKLPISHYNVFIMALCNQMIDISDLDNISGITTLHGTTVSDWISAGLLENVKAVFTEASVI